MLASHCEISRLPFKPASALISVEALEVLGCFIGIYPKAMMREITAPFAVDLRPFLVSTPHTLFIRSARPRLPQGEAEAAQCHTFAVPVAELGEEGGGLLEGGDGLVEPPHLHQAEIPGQRPGPKYARRTSPQDKRSVMLRVPMADDLSTLIRSGKLPSGTTLRHSFRSGHQNDVTAIVLDDGIRVKGKTYKTPSEAARAITRMPVDGWLFWKLPTGEPLDALRTDVRRISHGESH